MGGFIALHYAFSHPDMFVKVGGHQPALYLDASLVTFLYQKWVYSDESIHSVRDPLYLTRIMNLKGLKVYIDCRKNDHFRFYENCKVLFDTLQSRGVESEYHMFPRDHNQAYLEENIEKYLLFYAGIK